MLGLALLFAGCYRIFCSRPVVEQELHSDAEKGKNIVDWVEQLVRSDAWPSPGAISLNLVNHIIRVAVEMGVNRLALVTHMGLTEAQLRNPIGSMSGADVARLFDFLAVKTSDPLIAFTIGQRAAPRSFSDIGYTARLSRNLADRIKADVHIQQAHQQLANIIFAVDDRPPYLTWEYARNDEYNEAGFIEYSVSNYLRFAPDLFGEPMQARRMEFAHAARADVMRYEQFFKCPVAFNQPKTRLTLTARQLFRPSPIANPRVQDIAAYAFARPAQWMADGLKFSALGYYFLISEIDKSPLTLTRMAAALGTSERSLRRHLVNEGHPLRGLLDQVRQDLWMIYRAENCRELSEIALLLGYSELSAFTRSHKRWFGYAPSQKIPPSNV